MSFLLFFPQMDKRHFLKMLLSISWTHLMFQWHLSIAQFQEFSPITPQTMLGQLWTKETNITRKFRAASRKRSKCHSCNCWGTSLTFLTPGEKRVWLRSASGVRECGIGSLSTTFWAHPLLVWLGVVDLKSCRTFSTIYRRRPTVKKKPLGDLRFY